MTFNEKRVALLGYGVWGRNHARVYSELGALAAIGDIDTDATHAVTETTSSKVMTKEEIFSDKSIDGVIIATPPGTHAALAEAALYAGKDVLVEKPLALSSVEGRVLVNAAASNNRILMVGHLLRYHPAYLMLHKLINEGLIGPLSYIYSNRLHLGRFRTEENSLWSFAPHDVSMILDLFGCEPVSVSAVGHQFISKGVADVTVTNLAFPDGAGAHIHVSWLHPFREQRLVVIGERGMIVFEDSKPWPEKLLHYPHRIDTSGKIPVPERAEALPIQVEFGEPLRLQGEHFLSCMNSRQQPLTNGEEACRVLTVLEAAQNSMDRAIEFKD